jgi:hypothetical protein
MGNSDSDSVAADQCLFRQGNELSFVEWEEPNTVLPFASAHPIVDTAKAGSRANLKTYFLPSPRHSDMVSSLPSRVAT